MFFAVEKKASLIGLVSVFLFSLWAIMVLVLAPQYQNTAGSDPLAMINVLFPSFWVILLVFVGICFVAFVQSNVPRWLHMLLLAQFSLMLFYTPFLLSGFSWSPDSLWHGGVANYLPQIFSGARFSLGDYATAYPLLFFVTYCVEWIFGIDIFVYSLYVYPVICTILFSALSYFFASRIFNPKVAFLAMLFTLPALHYVEMHVSPFSAGTIILLAALVLSTYQGLIAKGLSILSIVVLAMVHPISPIMLGIYFFSVTVVNVVFRKKGGSETGIIKYSGFTFLVLIGIDWIVWTGYASTFYIGVRNAVTNLLNFSFLSRLFAVSDFAVGGSGFIYPWIQNLSLVIYGLILVLIFGMRVFGVESFKRFFRIKLDAITYKRMLLVFAGLIFAVMSFLLFLSSGERFLLGRGLLYFIFMGSMVIATYFVSEFPNWRRTKFVIALSLVVFLVCTFPVISYSKEAYNTFTPSADAGLRFLSDKIDLSEHSLSMSSMQQLASYVNLPEGLNLQSFPPNLNLSSPDVVAMRINGYFLVSMRKDLSFTDNSFTRLSAYLEESSDYNKVYSNSQFEVYELSP